jgi:hypothetical protein
VAAKVDEVQNLVLIKKMMKGGKEGGPKKDKMEESCFCNHGKDNSSHLTCFRCCEKRHHASQCLEKKKGKDKQQRKQFTVTVKIVAEVDESSSKLETTFSMVSCLSTNTISGDWVVCGQCNIHTYDLYKKIISKFHEQDVGMQVELGDDATYPVTGMGTC